MDGKRVKEEERNSKLYSLWHRLPDPRLGHASLEDENVGNGLQLVGRDEVGVELEERFNL